MNMKTTRKVDGQRKSLGTIQASASDGTHLKIDPTDARNSHKSKLNQSTLTDYKRVSQRRGEDSDRHLVEVGSQTLCLCSCHLQPCDRPSAPHHEMHHCHSSSLDDETVDADCSVGAKYWEETSERYRKALYGALEDNKALHQIIEQLRKEYDEMSRQAKQADLYSQILKTFVDEAEQEETVVQDKEPDMQETKLS